MQQKKNHTEFTGLLTRDTNFHLTEDIDLPEDFILQTSLLVALDEELLALEGIEQALNFTGKSVFLGSAKAYERTFDLHPEKNVRSNLNEIAVQLYQLPSFDVLKVLNQLVGYDHFRLDSSPRILKTVALARPMTEAKIYQKNFSSSRSLA